MKSTRASKTVAFVSAAIFATAVGLRAQTSAPVYKQLRYDEDYSALRDPAKRTDYVDPIKFIPLDESGSSWLTLGGEIRSQYEYFHNTLWGQGPQDNDGYILQRTMLHADWHFSDSVRLFTQLKSGLENGRKGGPRPTDEDRLDFNQAFLDLKLPAGSDREVTLRVGRQELVYGSSRLISYREAPNVRLAFDGARVIAETGSWRIDTFAVEPMQTKHGIFEDGNDPHQKLWGLYAVTPFPSIPGGHLDLYYLGLERDAVHFDEGTAREERHSVGFRLWGRASGWDYNFESLYQFGSFGSGNIAAWTVASDTGYTFATAVFQPHLGLKADIASGDRDPKQRNLQSFDPLFPRASYFNESALIGPVNFFDFHPTIELQIVKSVSLTADWDFLWRESIHDGLYGPAVNLVRSGQTTFARYIGSQPSLRVEWRSDRHWTVAAAYAHFFAGAFLRQSGPGRDVDYLSFSVTYLF